MLPDFESIEVSKKRLKAISTRALTLNYGWILYLLGIGPGTNTFRRICGFFSA